MSDVAAISPQYGEITHPLQIVALARSGQGYATISGGGLHQSGTPDMKVNMDAWVGKLAHAHTEAAAGYATADAQDAAYDRVDIAYIALATGLLTLHKGTAAAMVPAGATDWKTIEKPRPADDTLPEGTIVGLVRVRSTANGGGSITDADIWEMSAYDNIPLETVASVSVYQRGSSIFAKKIDGSLIASGVLGTDNNTVIDAAIAEVPTDGSIYVGPGRYRLQADKTFYLNGGTENPFNYCVGFAMEGKNMHLFGAGPGITVLEMDDDQFTSEINSVIILSRTTGVVNPGFTSASISNLTLDGRKAEQAVRNDDGPGLILTGSTRGHSRYYNLELLDSFGHGMYLGNNGAGSESDVIIYGIHSNGCYKSAICVDTASDVTISHCVSVDCNAGFEILGNTDYQTRDNDNIAMIGCITRRCGITVWCINDLTMNGCTVEQVGGTGYGLLVHSSIGVVVDGCKIKANHTSQFATFIDANTYMEDGPTEVWFYGCFFDAFEALKVFGEAIAHATGCTLKAYSTGAVIYQREMSETVTSKVYLTDCELIADAATTNLLDVAAQSAVYLNRCHAPKVGAFILNGGVYPYDCTGVGFARYKSRWMLETDTFNTTPASESTITMTVDRTAEILPGTPLKYLIGSTWYFGIVTAITSNLMTIAGAPLSGTIIVLYVGTPDMVRQIDYVIPGTFDSSASSTLLQSISKAYSIWRESTAYIVMISHRCISADSGTAPKVTAVAGGSVVGSDNGNDGLAVGTSWVHTVTGINTTNYKVDFLETLEVKTTAGGTGNATNLTVSLTLVMER